MPSAFFKRYEGSDLPGQNDRIRFISCAFMGETLAAVPAIRPDVTIIYAQVADRKGNVLIESIVSVHKEAVLSARTATVTLEDIVDDPLRRPLTVLYCQDGPSIPLPMHLEAHTLTDTTSATTASVSSGTPYLGTAGGS